MRLRLVLACLVATCADAFKPSPIRWGGDHFGRKFVLAPRAVPNMAVVNPSQKLTILDQQLSDDALPLFSPQPDKTITWDQTGLCIDASGDQDGDAVGVSRCTGSANQLWDFDPVGAGRENRIRLYGSNKCIDVNDKRRALNGASVELRDCADTESASWAIEWATQMESSFPWRHVVLSLTAMALLGLVSLAAILKKGQHARTVALSRCRSALLPVDEGGVCLSSWRARRGSVPSTPNVVPAVLAVSPAPVEDPEPAEQAALKEDQVKAADDTESSEQVAVMTVELEKPPVDDKVNWGELDVTEEYPTPDTIDFDNLAQYEQQQLELLYIDVLWSYYTKKKQLLSDDQYASLVNELNWKGSGFPALRRNEIAFVEAAIAFAKGEPTMSEEKWEVMKADIAASEGFHRQDVTQFLLYSRSLQEVAEVREKLMKEMGGVGIDLSMSPAGVSCTLDDVGTKLQQNVRDVLEMYVALSLVPTAIATSAWAVLALLAGGPGALLGTAVYGIPAAGVAAWSVTARLIQYVELAQPQLLKGKCPCCEADIGYMATSWNDPEPGITCTKCSTKLLVDVDNRELVKPQFVNPIDNFVKTEKKWMENVLNSALRITSDVVLGTPDEEGALSQVGKQKAGKPKKPEPGTGPLKYSADHLKDGIFAWAVLLGYGFFGEQFLQRVRGKGIQLHSQAIGSFCKRYAIPKKLEQRYIQTAKANGHDLGFLVPGQNVFGDGLFGKQALAWWKAQGF